MQPCLTVRVMDETAFTRRSGSDFAAALRHAREVAASRPIKYVLLDPFDQSITQLELRTVETADHWAIDGTRVNLHPADTELRQLLRAAKTGSWPVAENKATGHYTAILGRFMDMGEVVPRVPGVVVGGRVIFGRALMARGIELVTVTAPGPTQMAHLMDAHQDIQPEDYAGVRFLSFKEAREARAQWGVDIRAAVAVHAAAYAGSGTPPALMERELGDTYAPRSSCFHCQEPCSRTRKCSACGLAFYCGAACQHAHWKKHKGACRAAAAAAAAAAKSSM